MTYVQEYKCDQCRGRGPTGSVPPFGWHEVRSASSVKHFCSDICLAAWIGPLAEEREREAVVLARPR